MASQGTSPALSANLPALAPAPANRTREAPGAGPSAMAHSCRTCAMRKVRCDKSAPTCSTCRKARLDCAYLPLAPRQRKRRLSGDLNVMEKLARYERILREVGILQADGSGRSATA